MTSDTQSLGMNTSRSKLHCHTPVAIYSITKAGMNTAGNPPSNMTNMSIWSAMNSLVRPTRESSTTAPCRFGHHSAMANNNGNNRIAHRSAETANTYLQNSGCL